MRQNANREIFWNIEKIRNDEEVDMILTEYDEEKMQELFLHEIDILKKENEKERE